MEGIWNQRINPRCLRGFVCSHPEGHQRTNFLEKLAGVLRGPSGLSMEQSGHSSPCLCHPLLFISGACLAGCFPAIHPSLQLSS